MRLERLGPQPTPPAGLSTGPFPGKWHSILRTEAFHAVAVPLFPRPQDRTC